MLAVVVANAALVVGPAACAGEKIADTGGSAGAPIAPPDETGVIYLSGASDEAFRAVAGVAPTVDATAAPVLSEPGVNGVSYPRATPPVFAWSSLLARSSPPRSRGPRSLSDALFGSGLAHAHGEENNGAIYLVTISAEDGREHRVFTTATSYTPTADEWAALATLGGTLSIRVVGARVQANKVVAGGGPFVGETRTFTVEP